MKTNYTSNGFAYVTKVIAATDEALNKRLKWMSQRGWKLVGQYKSTTHFPLKDEHMIHLRFKKEVVYG